MKAKLSWLLPVLLVNFCAAWQVQTYKNCRCVPHKQCQISLHSKSFSGIGTNTATQENEKSQKKCKDHQSVCCPINMIIKKKDITPAMQLNYSDQGNPKNGNSADLQDNCERLFGQSSATKEKRDLIRPLSDMSMWPIPWPFLPTNFYSAGPSPRGSGNFYIGNINQQINIIHNNMYADETKTTGTTTADSIRTTPSQIIIDPTTSRRPPIIDPVTTTTHRISTTTTSRPITVDPITTTTFRAVTDDPITTASRRPITTITFRPITLDPNTNTPWPIFTNEQITSTPWSIFTNESTKTIPHSTIVDPITTGSRVTDVECTCVPYYLCKKDKTVNIHGTGLIQPRSLDFEKESWYARKGGKVCASLEICCKLANMVPLKNATMLSPRPPTNQMKCGQRNKSVTNLHFTETRNDKARFGEFPWAVAIFEKDYYDTGGNFVYRCGGALIHPQAVLSSAQCLSEELKSSSQFTVRIGYLDTQATILYQDHISYQERVVRSVINHDYFQSGISFQYDVALLILEQPVDLSYENVGIVCLPEADDNFDFSRCIFNGWGEDSYGKNGMLKSIELPVLPLKQCQSTVGAAYDRDISDNSICAGGESDKSLFKGDAGGPLVCPMKDNTDKYVQAGIASWGFGCGKDQLPSVFANVAAVRGWIDEKLAKLTTESNANKFVI